MAYDRSDPRSKLSGGAAATPPASYGSAEYVKFYETPPQIKSETEATWLARGQNFVVAYSEVQPGAVLARTTQADEYAVLLPESDTAATVRTEDEEARVTGRRILVVPPGTSSLHVTSGRRVVRVFSAAAKDLAEASANAASYRTPKPNIPGYRPWPAPADGYRLRSYDLDVPPQEGRFGRIWRCTTSMINHTEPRMGPRDVTKMSPHVHADFEQASLVLDGSFVHHIRWPWGTDMRNWRPDEHVICAGPSLAVIPPGSVHTSQQVSQGLNQLIDIFAPPRADFSGMDGWVLNAGEYPMPENTPPRPVR